VSVDGTVCDRSKPLAEKGAGFVFAFGSREATAEGTQRAQVAPERSEGLDTASDLVWKMLH